MEMACEPSSDARGREGGRYYNRRRSSKLQAASRPPQRKAKREDAGSCQLQAKAAHAVSEWLRG